MHRAGFPGVAALGVLCMLPRAVTTLAYAVRGRVIVKYYGQLAVSLVGLTALALPLALAEREWAMAVRLAVVTAVLGGGGWLLGRLRVPAHIQVNEALVIVVLAFVTGALALLWPFQAAGLPWVDAFFEAVSAITTTGLTTLESVEHRSATFLFLRAWAQWYGGLVIVVLALAMVLEPGRAAMRITEIEGASEDLAGGTRLRARRLLTVYIALTGVGFIVVWLAGVPAFEALLHVLSAVSTGGFSTHDASLAGLGGWPAQAAVTLLCLAGALSFALYFRTWREGWHHLLRDHEARLLVIWALVMALALAGTMAWAGQADWGTLARQAPLLALSAQTTAGFSSLPVSALDPASKGVLMVAMFVGGDVGSTAGGIKILRLLVLLRLIYLIVIRTSLPRHAVLPTHVAGARLPDSAVIGLVTVVALYGVVTATAWLPFLAAGLDPLDSLFEVVSALGTVGLSAGISGPGLPLGLKLLLCGVMLLGRLEVVAVLVVLYPFTWIGRKEQR